ncbi:NAD(P)H-dependent oxidoreductase [Longispora sp. K20-0274]|uniref:NADPH-dependent FMN reductase n=1 Tax=Longispora sp. K20-0274 TaxID=3088255 RepID=UPI00399AC4B7
MPQSPIRLAVIIGSTREGRISPTVARWFVEQAAQTGRFEIDLIDVADVEVRPDMSGGPTSVADRLDAAEAYVVVTPEYNHSFPGPLKSLIDAHKPEWRAKPVGFVSYGGVSGGLRAVEQLRLVFTELHCVSVRECVSFHGVWSRFDAEGALQDPTAAEGAAKVMLDQLAWWGKALVDAKAVAPYGV